MKHRDETSTKFKNSFTPDVSLVVHWDGKLLQIYLVSQRKLIAYQLLNQDMVYNES